MADLRTEVRLEGVEELLNDLERFEPTLAPRVRDEANATAAAVANDVKNRIRDGSGDTLHSRTGQLRRSIRYGSSGTRLRDVRAEVYSDASIASYAPVHELGATIRAKDAYRGLPGGPYLHFPVGQNLTPAGVQRMTGREVFAAGAHIRPTASPAFPYRVVLDGETMFLLTKQVTIPPRLEMIETAEDAVPDLTRRIGVLITEVLEA
jgi:hypothetical protein